MPPLNLCLLFNPCRLEKIEITKLILDKESQHLITATSLGDIVVWNMDSGQEYFEPRFLLVSSLDHSTGEVIGMAILDKPLQMITVITKF